MKNIKIYCLITCLFFNGNVFAENKAKEKDFVLLSAASIFKPLIADPKWPRFTLAYHYYISGVSKRSTFAPNFGAALPIIKWKSKDSSNVYEIGMHAALFAVMDIQTSPSRMINSDYFVGPTFSIKNNKLDYLFRISHLSSHLGDEYLLSPEGKKVTRINLSYETIEGMVAYNFDNGIRPFIGAGYIIHADPSSYKSAEFNFGIDYRHPHTFAGSYIRPIGGIYSKTSHNFHWNPSLSIKGGIEIKDNLFMGKELQILAEYYKGNSIHGQFYSKKIEYSGISATINF